MSHKERRVRKVPKSVTYYLNSHKVIHFKRGLLFFKTFVSDGLKPGRGCGTKINLFCYTGNSAFGAKNKKKPYRIVSSTYETQSSSSCFMNSTNIVNDFKAFFRNNLSIPK